MIEIAHRLTNCDRIVAWLDRVIRPRLRPDVSDYAKGRLRAWLRTEPTLTSPTLLLAGVPVEDAIWDRLAELIEWRYDYCLVTYSGDDTPIGITPHRDAGFANYEAISVHLSGECRFDYWEGRPGYDSRSNGRAFRVRRDGTVTENDVVVESTAKLIISPGDVVRFNCKDPHAATPGVKRWNMNFWRKKGVVK